MHLKSKFVLAAICAGSVLAAGPAFSQKKKKKKDAKQTTSTAAPQPQAHRPPQGKKSEPKKFDELINDKAVADTGLFNIYKQEDRYFFEIPDTLLNRDMIVVSRLSKSAAGMRAGMMGFAGDEINENMIRFEKGPNDKVFLRNISVSDVSKDSTQPMYWSVMNSNIQPIVASFDVKGYSKSKNGVIIDMTDYISGDNDVLFFDGRVKGMFKLTGVQGDKSYIVDVKSFPMNTEIKTVKTYGKAPQSSPGAPPTPGGNATVEINSSIILLPKVPMKPRYFDPRVGFFATGYTDFDADPQGIKRITMITRWRLEPKPEDMDKFRRGELVEPIKPIVFYIDPATPVKWRKYLIQGVNDWQAAFEQAGFKNAIYARMAPTKEEDSTWSLEDARFSAIVYKPSPIPNASGPHVHDPRSGEILESHINWYHNVMRLLRNWYFVQASPNDERARKMEFDDELMGELIRFVSSHEVGHTLGLRHNFGSSSTYPVEKLRDKEWVKKYGHAASIMDYARFNYVAQPGDGITGADLYPRINFYDKWAIEWGYKNVPGANTADEETPILNNWVINRLKDKIYWFGTEMNPDDPRSQNEDLGDNAMIASTYGIKNLQRIIPNLEAWTRTPNEGYSNLNELYNEVIGQFNRYNGHVAKNIGGIYETPKTVEQSGSVYEVVPKAKQKDAMAYLQKQLFTTPTWVISTDILSKTGGNATDIVKKLQDAVLGRLLNAYTLTKLVNSETNYGKGVYTANDLLTDLKAGIWKELRTRGSIDIYRRNLQKSYVDDLIKLFEDDKKKENANPMMRGGRSNNDPSASDVASLARAHAVVLRNEIRAASGSGDALTRYHLQDLANRLTVALDAK
ncbi:hypothetical protein COR50_01335 [Chitinophaga caeni]|uniref:Zinc-dependent metalloprotease n=1 Tax=Chitinophaga caeni TaxID=2029983 RepID=A0A291QPV1_9BACT|nr:zinc-dependent metalloprotease [Chitinophaga caeni]ATL45912.1 hypothetical protein COR50_01335 [Chitinophaga caeni]